MSVVNFGPRRDIQFIPPRVKYTTSLVMKLYSDAMCPQVPVGVVSPIFKVAENGHRYVEAGELFPADWAEPKTKDY